MSKARLWQLATIICLGIAMVSFFVRPNSSKQIQALENRLELLEQQGKLEVVGRYFIAHYYSGESERLSQFLSSTVQEEGITAKTGQQLQSIVYESMEQVPEGLSTTFVVTTTTDSQEQKTNRMTLVFKEEPSSIYGYVLDGQPVTTPFVDK